MWWKDHEAVENIALQPQLNYIFVRRKAPGDNSGNQSLYRRSLQGTKEMCWMDHEAVEDVLPVRRGSLVPRSRAVRGSMRLCISGMTMLTTDNLAATELVTARCSTL